MPSSSRIAGQPSAEPMASRIARHIERAVAVAVAAVDQCRGRRVALGTYDASVVNQALRYASDKRVVATTITPGDGEVVSRITYLHPALVDTPLGCRVVEADRLIDTFSFGGRSGKPGARLTKLASDREGTIRY